MMENIDGEALYSQQKQDQELIVAQTMNSFNNQPHPLPLSVEETRILTGVRWFFGTLVHHLWFAGFLNKVLILCPRQVVLRLTGLSCSTQCKCGLRNKARSSLRDPQHMGPHLHFPPCTHTFPFTGHPWPCLFLLSSDR